MEVRELQAKRFPVLEERNALMLKGDVEGVKRCNAELRKLNLAIQGIEPYVEEKPVPVAPELTPGQKAAATRKANKLRDLALS